MIYFKNFQALYKKGDILIVISTSGKSKNIIKILKYTSSKIFSLGLLGNNGGDAKKYCSENIIVPSTNVNSIYKCSVGYNENTISASSIWYMLDRYVWFQSIF